MHRLSKWPGFQRGHRAAVSWDRVRESDVLLSWGWRRGRFFAGGRVFQSVDLTQQFWSGPDNIAIVIQDERDKGGYGLPRPGGTFQGVFVVRMSLGSHEDAADGSRSFQRHWIVSIVGIEQCYRAKL